MKINLQILSASVELIETSERFDKHVLLIKISKRSNVIFVYQYHSWLNEDYLLIWAEFLDFLFTYLFILLLFLLLLYFFPFSRVLNICYRTRSCHNFNLYVSINKDYDIVAFYLIFFIKEKIQNSLECYYRCIVQNFLGKGH